MKQVAALFFVLVLSAIVLLPIPKNGQAGAYNTVSGLAYCGDYDTCLHEIAHALDQRAGWISQSRAFCDALQMYLYVELKKPVAELPAALLELTFRNDDAGNKRELYAYIFQQSAGNPLAMPVVFRQFYDWDKAELLVANLHDGTVFYFMR